MKLVSIAAFVTALMAGGSAFGVNLPAPASTVEVADAMCGTFAVPGIAEGGVAIHNGSRTTLYVKFNPTGEWSYHDASNFVPSCGITYTFAEALKFPNLALAQLAITRDGIEGGKVDATDEFQIASDETVYLLMNDVPGQYSDNQGAIQITYTAATHPQ